MQRTVRAQTIKKMIGYRLESRIRRNNLNRFTNVMLFGDMEEGILDEML